MVTEDTKPKRSHHKKKPVMEEATDGQEPIENFRRLEEPMTPEAQELEVNHDQSEGQGVNADYYELVSYTPVEQISATFGQKGIADPDAVTVQENQPEADPTQPIGRPRRRPGPKKELQSSFNEEVIDVENGELALLAQLEARDETLEQHKEFTAAERDIKKALTRMGYYDGQPHTIRAGMFVIVLAPTDGPPKEIAFTREPSTRMTIKRDD